MKLNFCTLFNSAYLSRGLTMYKSLAATCADFHLYVFAFDQITFDFFKQQNYPHLTAISLQEFEDSELLRIKPSRTSGEYCWTCTSSTILYSIQKYNLPHCTYVDADLYFYSDPVVLVEEMKNNSVLITEHRYTAAYDQSKSSGIYCVQFIIFKNDAAGLKVLNWWRAACIEWCYNRHEDGKFGDQKYLDDWTQRFEGIHVLQNLGGGIAPWNVQQYEFRSTNSKLMGKEKSTNTPFQPVFYHFHDLKFHPNQFIELTGAGYEINADVVELFYKSYLKNWKVARKEISENFKPEFDADATSKKYIPSRFRSSLYALRVNARLAFEALKQGKLKFAKHHNHIYNLKSF